MQDKEILELFNDKLDKKTFWMLLLPLATATFATIINLYVIYYSGLGELKVKVAELSVKMENTNTQIADIKSQLKGLELIK